MSGNAPQIALPQLPHARVAIISSSWHLDICNDLIAGASRALKDARAEDAVLIAGSLYLVGSARTYLRRNL